MTESKAIWFGVAVTPTKPKPVCPECGGETATQRWLAHECSAGCDTALTYCLECDWQGDPQ